MKCPFCNITYYQIFFKREKDTILRCKNCGLIYIYPQPSENEIKEFYNSPNYYKSNDFIYTGYKNYVEDKINIENTAKKRLRWIQSYIKKGKILDIGCGGGFFLNIAKNHGWSCYGVEISKHILQYASNELQLKEIISSLKEANFPEEFFDVITMWDVIEHLKYLKEELLEINRVLKKNGLLVIITPNAGSIIAKITGKKWVLFNRKDHLLFFTPHTLINILNKIGFKVVKYTPFYYGGKYVSLDYIFSRLKEYNKLFYFLLKIVRFLKINNIVIYADMGDNMTIFAKKLT